MNSHEQMTDGQLLYSAELIAQDPLDLMLKPIVVELARRFQARDEAHTKAVNIMRAIIDTYESSIAGNVGKEKAADYVVQSVKGLLSDLENEDAYQL